MIAQHGLARAKKRLEQLAFLRGLDPTQVDSCTLFLLDLTSHADFDFVI